MPSYPTDPLPRATMHHGISPPQDADLFGLIYGFRFRPGKRGGKSTRLPPSPACGRLASAGRVPLAAPEPRPCRLRALDEEASGTAGLFLRKPARGVALDAHRTRRLGAAGSGQRRGLQLRPGLFGRRHPVGLRPWPAAGQCTSATAALGGQAALFGEARRTFPFAPCSC